MNTTNVTFKISILIKRNIIFSVFHNIFLVNIYSLCMLYKSNKYILIFIYQRSNTSKIHNNNMHVRRPIMKQSVNSSSRENSAFITGSIRSKCILNLIIINILYMYISIIYNLVLLMI